MVTPVGKHCILELHDCPSHLLNDLAYVRETVTEASKQGMSTLLDIVATQFEPQGVTALGLLAESHISVHTWPEFGYGAVDIFTCGEHADPQRACQFMVERFAAGRHRLRVLPRGGALEQASESPGSGESAAPHEGAQDEEEVASCPEPDSKPTSGSPNTSVRPTCTTMA